MKAIVTGAGGFVGGYLVAALREAGWMVVTLSRRAPADRVGDLARMPLRGLSADVVFHLAGFANPSASLEAPFEAFEANAASTARLLREVPYGRLVLASSCQVYAPAPGPLPESAPLAPRNPYAASKLWAETLVRASGRAVVLRPFNHTGPGQSEHYLCPFVAAQVVRAECGRGPAVIRLQRTSARLDLFDVRDMARAYILAAERGRPGEIYNAGTGHPVAIRDLVRLFQERARRRLSLDSVDGPPTTLSADASKLRDATGWRPLIPLSRTVEDLLDHERARIGGATATP